MHVLVIGGTQFFGRRIVEKLLERGAKVTVFSRGKKRPLFWPDVETVIGDRQDKEQFVRLLGAREFDVVIDNIAYDADDVETAVTTFAGRIGHYVLCSSVAVYPAMTSRQLAPIQPVYEDDADLHHTGDWDYAEGKRAAERVLWSLVGDEQPFQFTVLRPAVVEGPHDPTLRTWFWVQRLLDGGPILVPETSPTTIFRHVYADDVAEAFVRTAANPATFGKAYNIAGTDIVSLADYAAMLLQITSTLSDATRHRFGARDEVPRLVRAPINAIRAQPGLEQWNTTYMEERFVPMIQRMKRDLGVEPTPMDQWLRETVAWHVTAANHLPDSRHYDLRRAERQAAQMLQSH